MCIAIEKRKMLTCN